MAKARKKENCGRHASEPGHSGVLDAASDCFVASFWQKRQDDYQAILTFPTLISKLSV
jgi:hypothetical protein